MRRAKLRPANNGYAWLKLPAGRVSIELQGNGGTRSQTLDIMKLAHGW